MAVRRSSRRIRRIVGRWELARSARRRWQHQEQPRGGPRFRPRKSITERIVPAEAPPARPRMRLRLLAVTGVALFSVMVVRLWYLQVLDTGQYRKAVETATTRQVEVPAPRGLILDRSGGTLVGDQVEQVISLSRQAAETDPQVVGSLAALLGVPAASIESALTDPRYSLYEPVPIAVNAALADVISIDEHPTEFPGVKVEAITDRSYPLDDPSATSFPGVQVWGTLQTSTLPGSGSSLGAVAGASGLEAAYNTALTGKPGVDNVLVNAQNQVVATQAASKAQAGDDLVTNIDAGLEQTVQNALDAMSASIPGNPGGAAVVMDPRSGAVLAMASDPVYNPADWVDGQISQADWGPLDSNPADPLMNKAIDGLYTPGSSFKLATATAALQDGLWQIGQYFNDTGSYTPPGCTGCTPLHDDPGTPLGATDIQKALTVSDDDFFYNLGATFWDARSTYGQDAIQQWANQLGFGTVTSIDLPGETNEARIDSPQVVAKEHAQYPQAYPNGGWYTGDNEEMAFGQGGTLITPIDEAVAYATFANGGTRYAPEVGAGLVDPGTGTVVRTIVPKVTGHVAYTPQNHQAILQGLEGVISNPLGTGYQAFVGFPFSTFGQLAGKTGTATVSLSGQPNSWFSVFGPVADPQYEVTVVIPNAGYGASFAAPVARQIFNYLVAHPVGPVQLKVPPTTGPCAAAGSTGSSKPGSSGSAGSSGARCQQTTASAIGGQTTTQSGHMGANAGLTFRGINVGSTTGGAGHADRPRRATRST